MNSWNITTRTNVSNVSRDLRFQDWSQPGSQQDILSRHFVRISCPLWNPMTGTTAFGCPRVMTRDDPLMISGYCWFMRISRIQKAIDFLLFGPEMTARTHGLSLPAAPSCRVFVRELFVGPVRSTCLFHCDLWLQHCFQFCKLHQTWNNQI